MKASTMDVRLIGHTVATQIESLAWGWPEDEMQIAEPEFTYQEDVTDSDRLAEFGGRLCYRSFNRPNPKTEENDDYLRHILDVGHESVIQHASATFYVRGVSRALTHELIRHRFLGFSEISQRYVGAEQLGYVIPPALADHPYLVEEVERVNGYARQAYDRIVTVLQSGGVKRKQAREAARAVLPSCTETQLVVSGNLRAWRDFLKQRWHVAADAEIREFAYAVLVELNELAPHCFQDFDLENPASYE